MNELRLQEENDELPSWSEIIDIDDHIDELETEEFYESPYSDTDNCELITIDEMDEWQWVYMLGTRNGITGIFTIK